MPKIKGFDPRPSKAHPEARAARKKVEKENPHFDMIQNFGIKAGAIALLTAVAMFPWEKEYEKHERNHHPERFEEPDNHKNSNKVEEGHYHEKKNRGRREDRDRDGDRRRRRQSAGGERETEYRTFLDRDREYRLLPVESAPSSVGASAVGGSADQYAGSDDGEYGRQYIEACKRERGKKERDSERRRRGSAEYEYGRSSRP